MLATSTASCGTRAGTAFEPEESALVLTTRYRQARRLEARPSGGRQTRTSEYMNQGVGREQRGIQLRTGHQSHLRLREDCGTWQEARAFASDRVFIVTDPGIVAVGLADKAVKALSEAGLESRTFAGISANPRDEECCEAAAAAIAFGAQAIVGLGGGSALDTAKAAAALVTNGGRVKDWEDPRRLESDPLPLIAVPTTAGTGARSPGSP